MIRITPALKKFISYAKPYRWWIVGATVCGLLKYNIPVIFPWIFKDVIDSLLSASSEGMHRIHADMLILTAVYIVWSVITYYRSHWADRASQRLIFDLRQDLWSHLQRLTIGYYENRHVGSVASRLLADTAIAQNFIGAAVTNTIMDSSSLFLITILLFYMNWKLALVSIVILPFYVVLNKYFKTRIRSTSKLAQQKMEDISGAVHEKLSGMSIIQAYTLEKLGERQFFQENRTYLEHRFANIKNNALAAAIIGFLTSIAPVLVVWFGALQVVHGYLSVGELTAFYVYLGMFYQPLNRLSNLNIMIANSESAIERIFEVFRTAPDIQNISKAKVIPFVQGHIEFSGVCFGYKHDEFVLRDISLQVPAGKTIALVGHSGAGKSTFVKLIPRFYDVIEGAIRIDGIDIREFHLRSLRQQIAVVPQDPILFSGTVRENILMGKSNARDEEIQAAAKAANAHEFIAKLPERYETEIGEGGVKLSGGQKQRLALARAFLKNAPILVLDEATSALDSKSENLIQEALKRLMVGRTTFIIAHRLSTIQTADQIVVFKNGRIVEIGRHEELLESSTGTYRHLYDQQYQNIELSAPCV